jgi:hypothetical protein
VRHSTPWQDFFFGFCNVIKLMIIYDLKSQIWLHTRYKSIINTKSLYVLGYLLKLIIKNWLCGIIFLRILVNFDHFSWKNLCTSQNHILKIKMWQKLIGEINIAPWAPSFQKKSSTFSTMCICRPISFVWRCILKMV